MGADTVVRRRVAPGYQTALFGCLDEGLEAAVVIVDEAVDGLGSSRRGGKNEDCEDGEKRQKCPRR